MACSMILQVVPFPPQQPPDSNSVQLLTTCFLRKQKLWVALSSRKAAALCAKSWLFHPKLRGEPQTKPIMPWKQLSRLKNLRNLLRNNSKLLGISNRLQSSRARAWSGANQRAREVDPPILLRMKVHRWLKMPLMRAYLWEIWRLLLLKRKVWWKVQVCHKLQRLTLAWAELKASGWHRWHAKITCTLLRSFNNST